MSFNRRHFLHGAASIMAAPAFIPRAALAADAAPAAAGPDPDTYLQGRLYKTLKYGMIGVGESVAEKLAAAKAAGFDGIEVDTPGINVEQVREAIKSTGVPVDGSVCNSHWNIRHTNADAAQRATALEHLKQSLREVHAIGGNSVLLVVGHGNDGPEAEIWPRSIENIAKALPLAAELGVYIAIENVWNHFLYDHGGDHTQTAAKFVKYVDELNSPWVGMQFDIGNHQKYGDPAAWIRQLGRRIVKLDVKGYNRAKQAWSDISEPDIDWADVRKALMEIGYTGWVAAEVGGGDLNRLKTVASQMDTVFGLKPKA